MGTLNDNIKAVRKEKGLTLLQLAEKIGVKEATIQRYESGEIKNIKHETVVALAKAMGVSPSRLMGWDEDIPVAAHISSPDGYEELSEEQQEQIQGLVDLFKKQNEERK